MKVLVVAFLREEKAKMEFQDIAYNVSSFNWFVRSTISEYLKFACRTIVDSSFEDKNFNVNISVVLDKISSELPKQMEGYKALCLLVKRGEHAAVGGIMIVDEEYPSRVAFSWLSQKIITLDSTTETNFANLKEELTKLQNPHDLPEGKIEKIQKQLEDVKEIMHDNIEKVILRGEDLNSLMQKSADLSASSKKFIDDTKKLNRCCKWY